MDPFEALLQEMLGTVDSGDSHNSDLRVVDAPTTKEQLVGQSEETDFFKWLEDFVNTGAEAVGLPPVDYTPEETETFIGDFLELPIDAETGTCPETEDTNVVRRVLEELQEEPMVSMSRARQAEYVNERMSNELNRRRFQTHREGRDLSGDLILLGFLNA